MLAVTVVDTEASPMAGFSDASICQYADSLPVNKAYLREALKRGLTCSARNFPEIVRQAAKRYDRESLCYVVTTNGRWQSKAGFQNFVEEAARRNETCGVSEPNPIVEASARMAAINPSDLCDKAVNSSNGDWDSRSDWKPFADEAKRRGLTCEDRKAEVRQKLAAAAAERDRKAEAKRQANLLALQTNPMSVALAEEVALSMPFESALVPQMNDLMLCVQGKFRKNDVLSAEISKRGIRCGKLLELMR